MMRRAAKPAIVAMFCLSVLSACGGLTGKTQGGDDSEWLQSLREAGQHGEVGSVEGLLYLGATGVPMPLRDWPVILIPLPPAIEAAVTDGARQYATGGRTPLSPPDFARAHQPIDAYLRHLETTGHGDLVKQVKTDPGTDPTFRFTGVPAGRWLLLVELASPISHLLWALPVTVTAGAATRQSLNDTNNWIEGLTRP